MTNRSPIYCLAALLAASHGVLSAQVTGQSTGLQVTGVSCRNLSTGEAVIDTSGLVDWDCAALGLGVSSGDRVETGLRGQVVPPVSHLGLDVRSAALPADFQTELIADVSSSGLLTGDLDADEDLDVLGSGPLTWFENLGEEPPSFAPHDLTHLVPLGSVVQDPVIVDANGDGKLDFVASSLAGAGFNRFSLFRNAGGSPPTFSRRDILAEFGWDFSYGVPADIDGDSDVDFYVARMEVNCGQNCVDKTIWMENVDNNVYVEHTVDPTDGGSFLAVVDFDGDGDPDVVGTVGATFKWIENDNLTFTVRSTPVSSIVFFDLTPVDLDGDGDPDIVGRTFDDLMLWMENIDGGADWVEHVLPGDPSNGFAMADLTGDGRPDLAIANFSDPIWLENLGGSPLEFRQHPLPFAGVSVTVGPGAGDLDDDGRIDLLGRTSEETNWYRNQIGRRLTVGGMSVRGFFCRNRTTGQTVRVQTTDTAIDCENEGLTVDPGDEVEVFARGQAL